MPNNEDNWQSTRTSLLRRLKNWSDDASWQEFFEIYGKLIYRVARKSGLRDHDAKDVVQETFIAIAKQMPKFEYNPALGAFKAWLLNLTRWRIADHFRQKPPPTARSNSGASTRRTRLIDRVPDPAGQDLESVWEVEWQSNLLATALNRVKARLDPQKYQVFDLYVHKEWPAEKVAARFSIPVDQVYLTKHRVTELLKKEIARLEVKGI